MQGYEKLPIIRAISYIPCSIENKVIFPLKKHFVQESQIFAYLFSEGQNEKPSDLIDLKIDHEREYNVSRRIDGYDGLPPGG
jgi:hypothetical protein